MPKEAKAKSRATAKKDKPVKKKDPNAPKKALSPYMFFTQEWRDKIKEENPGISFGEVAKRLGSKWKAMSDDDKEPYVKKHQDDKERAEKDKEAYENRKGSAAASGGEEDDDE